MPPRRIRKLNGSTDQSVRWLNYAHTTSGNLPDPTRRRATNETNVYDLPVSPERPRPERNLRSRPVPAKNVLPSNDSTSSEDEDESQEEHEEEDHKDHKDQGEQEQSSGAGPQSVRDASSPNDAPSPIANEHESKEEVELKSHQEAPESDDDEDEYDPESNVEPRTDSLAKIHESAGDDVESQTGVDTSRVESNPGSDINPDQESDDNEDLASDNASTDDRDQLRDESPGADEPNVESEGDSEIELFVEAQTEASSSDASSRAEEQAPQTSPQTQSRGLQLSHESKHGSRSSQIHSSQPRKISETPQPAKRPSPPYVERAVSSHGIFTWMTETIKESGFKETWDVIRRTRNVKRGADPSMRECFQHIRRMKVRLQGLYETMSDDETWDSRTKDGSRGHCSLIANNIFKEIQWIIFDEAQADENTGDYLVEQLEAHVVPWLIELVYFGFRAYKNRGDWARCHFRISLDLLWGCSYKISCYSDRVYGAGKGSTDSRGAMPAVKTIKDALDDGRLREIRNVPHPPRYRHFSLTEVESQISCGPWKRVEKDGLRRAFEKAVLNGVEGERVSSMSNESCSPFRRSCIC
ncbi:unnamed protein product [Penicillium salamii]|uniref:Uncharacterized protein n=1 Tax=Penicillium salamii TaxID=1612424 RepID=A0A9W4NGM1_9EURO|nr:unnamed protein product [Penicillium salamii]CAG8313974.1 unnamed protein product [Penicillium salamii]CAG8340981.1 unnamed protein product [Penicillium salamii]CAG8364387.1 unnamed protein product [Penicillium salamii]CAG8373995.1 unnamed protein product [Penicillium salamii]